MPERRAETAAARASTADPDDVVAAKKAEALRALSKAAKAVDARACVRAHDLAVVILRAHRRPEVAREIVRAALPVLPRGIPGARVRESYHALELDACVELGLESEAEAAAAEATAISGRASYLGRLGQWFFEKRAYASSANAFRRASSSRSGADPWLLKLACVLAKQGSSDEAAASAGGAIVAIDRTLAALTAEHHATARAGAAIRKAVGLVISGDAVAARATFARAVREAEPSTALRDVLDDPVWADVTRQLST